MHRFDGKTIKTTQNYKETRSNYDQFASIWRQSIKTIKNVVFRRKTIKKPQNYEYDQIIMNCNDLMSKKSKERKTTKLRRKTFKITQNYESDHIIMHCIDLTSKRSNLQTRSNYDQFAPIWRQNIKTIKNVELRRKTFKTTQNYESDQITTDCIDLMAKKSNQRKTTKVIILRSNCIDLTSKRPKQRKTTKRIKL